MSVEGVLPGMSIVSDIVYGDGDGVPLLLDLVQPDPRPRGPMPALVWIHGGGWRFGDKRVETSQSIGLEFVRAGFTCLSINYRLSHQALFPAQIHDAKASIRWLRAHAADLGVDPERIGVWGHSAGAHLAALLGVSGDLSELEGDSGSSGSSSRVQAVVAIAAPSDFLAIPDGWPHEEPRVATSLLVGGRLEERRELVRMANPITYVHPGLPPFLLIHGEDDEVVPILQGDLLADALARSDAEVTYLRRPHANHMLESAKLGIDRQAAWIDLGRLAFAFFQTHLGD